MFINTVMSFPYEGSYRPSVDQQLCRAVFLILVYGFICILSLSGLTPIFQSNESSSWEIIDMYIFICTCNIYKITHIHMRGRAGNSQ